jgi:hypothetical protein
MLIHLGTGSTRNPTFDLDGSLDQRLGLSLVRVVVGVGLEERWETWKSMKLRPVKCFENVRRIF